MVCPDLPPLYVVTDRHQIRAGTLLERLPHLLAHPGVMLQVREKDLSTRDLLSLAQSAQTHAVLNHVPLLINDRLDVAMAVGASGVHLRSDSLPMKVARQCLGPEKIIGVSVHSVEEARHGEEEGADFVVLGPIYDTPSKRSFGPPLGVSALVEASAVCRIPVYAIGGITLDRVEQVKEAGAYGVAVISAILSAEDPGKAVKDFTTRLGVTKP